MKLFNLVVLARMWIFDNLLESGVLSFSIVLLQKLTHHLAKSYEKTVSWNPPPPPPPLLQKILRKQQKGSDNNFWI